MQDVAEFATTVRGLPGLRDWLAAHGVTHLAMEATGVYWRPVWAILEDRFECILVNARHVKQVPGRKTDAGRCLTTNLFPIRGGWWSAGRASRPVAFQGGGDGAAYAGFPRELSIDPRNGGWWLDPYRHPSSSRRRTSTRLQTSRWSSVSTSGGMPDRGPQPIARPPSADGRVSCNRPGAGAPFDRHGPACNGSCQVRWARTGPSGPSSSRRRGAACEGSVFGGRLAASASAPAQARWRRDRRSSASEDASRVVLGTRVGVQASDRAVGDADGEQRHRLNVRELVVVEVLADVRFAGDDERRRRGHLVGLAGW